MNKGDRVQLHPATDRWMMGDRYGEVVRSRVRSNHEGSSDKYTMLHLVKLDKSGKKVWFLEDNLIPMMEGV